MANAIYLEPQKKVPLISFSGGLDSTYLLYKQLQEGDVETIYITSSQAPNKVAMEKRRRGAIIALLEKKTGHRVLKDHDLDIGWRFSNPSNEWKFRQAPAWLFGALEVISFERHSCFMLGYVACDQITYDAGWVEQAWTALQRVAKNTNPVPIDFPIRYMSKPEMMQFLPYQKLLKMIWVCETPIIDNSKPGEYSNACGCCPACEAFYGAYAIYLARKRLGKCMPSLSGKGYARLGTAPKPAAIRNTLLEIK